MDRVMMYWHTTYIIHGILYRLFACATKGGKPMKRTIIIILTLTLCLLIPSALAEPEPELLNITQLNELTNEVLREYGEHTVQVIARAGWYPWDDPETTAPHGWLQLEIRNGKFQQGSALHPNWMEVPFGELAEKGFINSTDNGNEFGVDLTKVKPLDPKGTLIEGALIEKEWFVNLLLETKETWEDFTWLSMDEANTRIEGYGLQYTVGKLPGDTFWPQMQLMDADGTALPAGLLLEEHFRVLEDGSVEVRTERFDAYVEWARGLLRDGYGK